MEDNIQTRTIICKTKVGNEESNIKDASQSHAHIKRLKKEELRSTKSFELHHTRSFSEIRHLHPSSTDVSFGITCPKPRNIEALQREVKRPESVLEISDLSVQDDEDDIEEDIDEAQEKGDKAMQLFMQSNISIPLDGAMTSSSSCSLQSLDSDMASEHELIVGTWKDDGRDSVALLGSSLEKRFLTPSGQLLYREQQVESMLDTKRFKLSPSSSVERPMSPLAVHNTSTMKTKNQQCDGDDKNDIETSTNKQDEQHDSSHSHDDEECFDTESDNEKEIQKRKKCDCDHYNKLQDLQRVMKEYECQYGELVKRREKNVEEMKTLKKDNINVHKEHNRLQIIVKECYKQEEIVKEKVTKMVVEKEKKIEELNVSLRYLNDKINRQNEDITGMTNTIEEQKLEISTYDEIFKEISSESTALVQALAKELGEDQVMYSNADENGEAILSVLKKRRCSLHDDFKSFSKTVLHPPVWTKQEEMKCSQTTDESIDKLHNHLQDDFHELKSGYKTTLSHVQQTERNVENIQQQTIGLKTMLSASKNKESKKEIEWQLQELQEKHDETRNENRIMKEDLTKWTNQCDRVTKDHSKLKAEYEKLYEEKQQANLKLQALKTDLRKRLENSYREKTTLEKQLKHLKEKYLNTDTNGADNPEFGSQDADLTFVTTSKEKENERATLWKKERNEWIEKTKVLKNQLVEQGKLIECLVEEGQNANKNLNTEKSGFLEEKVMEVLPSNTTNLERNKNVNAAEDRLSQLFYLTDALSDKIEKTSQHMAPTDKRLSLKKEKKTLTTFGEDKMLWEIKEIYQEQFDNIQDAITNQQVENRSLKEQLELKERDEEINKFYIASLKKANKTSEEHLEKFKTKHHDLKKELRDVKDRLLVIDAEQRMSRYFNQKKERKTVQEK